MTRDYYPALKRATAALGSQTAQARRAVYDRARSFIAAAGLSERQAGAERAALETAIERIEAEQEIARAASPRFRRPLERTGSRSARPLRGWWPPAAATIALLIAGLTTWALWPNRIAEPAPTTRAAAVPAVPAAAAVPVPAAPAAPASRPEAAPRSYVFNRQVVYYRSVQPVGTIHIAKAQQFLYLIVADTSAIRYTIGVGLECVGVAGLLVVSAKEEAAANQAQRVAEIGQPEPRSGPRSLVLGDEGRRIHGPTPTGEARCFSLVAEDISHLYDRVSVGTRVVIN